MIDLDEQSQEYFDNKQFEDLFNKTLNINKNLDNDDLLKLNRPRKREFESLLSIKEEAPLRKQRLNNHDERIDRDIYSRNLQILDTNKTKNVTFSKLIDDNDYKYKSKHESTYLHGNQGRSPLLEFN